MRFYSIVWDNPRGPKIPTTTVVDAWARCWLMELAVKIERHAWLQLNY
jgi:hypothetical protein